MHQVRFTQTYTTVKKQGVVRITGILRHLLCRSQGQLVRFTLDEIIKGVVFNQVVLMLRCWAHAMTAGAGTVDASTFDWQLLERRIPTASQTGLGRQERIANLRDAFGLRPHRSVRELNCLIVDDVYSTGATVSECARLLRKQGAARVDVLTLARTIKPEHFANAVLREAQVNLVLG